MGCVYLTAHRAHGDTSRYHRPCYDQATSHDACREPRNPHCGSCDGLAFGVDDPLPVLLLFVSILLSLVLGQLRRRKGRDRTRQPERGRGVSVRVGGRQGKQRTSKTGCRAPRVCVCIVTLNYRGVYTRSRIVSSTTWNLVTEAIEAGEPNRNWSIATSSS